MTMKWTGVRISSIIYASMASEASTRNLQGSSIMVEGLEVYVEEVDQISAIVSFKWNTKPKKGARNHGFYLHCIG